MEFEYLETCRLRLRKLDQEVFDFIFTTYSDQELLDFFAFKTKKEVEEQKEKYAKGFSTFNRSFLNFQLIEKVSGQIIGSCGFHTWYLNHDKAEIGYALDLESAKRKAYMSEALKAIIEYGFVSMNLNRIEAFVGETNVPSLSLMSNFGFKQEGHMKEDYLRNEVYEDSLAFALLKNDYKST